MAVAQNLDLLGEAAKISQGFADNQNLTGDFDVNTFDSNFATPNVANVRTTLLDTA